MKSLIKGIGIISLISLSISQASLANPGGRETTRGTGAHGGDYIDISGVPVLRDLVDKTVCEWVKPKRILNELPDWPKLMNAIREYHWFLPLLMEHELNKLDFCLSHGDLIKINTEDVDGVSVHLSKGKQIAIRINNQVYMAYSRFKKMRSLPKASTIAHEVIHGLIPFDIERRNHKVRSMIHFFARLLKENFSSEHFFLQLERNAVFVSSNFEALETIRPEIEGMFTPGNSLLQKALAAHQLNQKFDQLPAHIASDIGYEIRSESSHLIYKASEAISESINLQNWTRLDQIIDSNAFYSNSASFKLLSYMTQNGESPEMIARLDKVLSGRFVQRDQSISQQLGAWNCFDSGRCALNPAKIAQLQEVYLPVRSDKEQICYYDDNLLSCALRNGLNQTARSIIRTHGLEMYTQAKHANVRNDILGIAMWNPAVDRELFEELLAAPDMVPTRTQFGFWVSIAMNIKNERKTYDDSIDTVLEEISIFDLKRFVKAVRSPKFKLNSDVDLCLVTHSKFCRDSYNLYAKFSDRDSKNKEARHILTYSPDDLIQLLLEQPGFEVSISDTRYIAELHQNSYSSKERNYPTVTLLLNKLIPLAKSRAKEAFDHRKNGYYTNESSWSELYAYRDLLEILLSRREWIEKVIQVPEINLDPLLRTEFVSNYERYSSSDQRYKRESTVMILMRKGWDDLALQLLDRASTDSRAEFFIEYLHLRGARTAYLKTLLSLEGTLEVVSQKADDLAKEFGRRPDRTRPDLAYDADEYAKKSFSSVSCSWRTFKKVSEAHSTIGLTLCLKSSLSEREMVSIVETISSTPGFNWTKKDAKLVIKLLKSKTSVRRSKAMKNLLKSIRRAI